MRDDAFECLPPHKTLFKAKTGCGFPIGNLTSQFFANTYLDALDQFIKRSLRVKYYVRYCDDMVLLSKEKTELEQWEKEIRVFLGDQLKLELNERRKLRPVGDGIDFLGYIVRPDYLLVRRRVIGALRERLKAAEAALTGSGMAEHPDGHSVFPWPQALIGEVLQWLNSYLGHIKKASGHRLMESIRRRFRWLDEYFVREGNKATLRCPIPRFTLRFSQQKRWFQKHLPGHVLLIRKGVFWEIDVEACGTDLSDFHWPDRIHFRRKRQVKSALWKADVPVAWIGETGRRLGRIAERALVCRWTYNQG